MSGYIEVTDELLKYNRYIGNEDEYKEIEIQLGEFHSRIWHRRDPNSTAYGIHGDYYENLKDEIKYLTEKIEEFNYNIEPYEQELKNIDCRANAIIKRIRKEYNEKILIYNHKLLKPKPKNLRNLRNQRRVKK